MVKSQSLPGFQALANARVKLNDTIRQPDVGKGGPETWLKGRGTRSYRPSYGRTIRTPPLLFLS